ncbi:hypothetical protein H4R19_002561 [Coemansia spiralis]|nr:hypothetical protein H4R19_002561 [Coemansia spiralis]
MQLIDFPAEILTAVLRRTLRYPDYGRRLERNLPLVAVCRRLRYIALPIVYEEAYVDIFDENSTWRDEYNMRLSPVESALSTQNEQRVRDDWVAISNVDHIASMGYIGLVQHMRIVLEASFGHAVGLRYAVRYLSTVASEWPTVKRLEICINGPTHDPRASIHDLYSEDWDDPEDAVEFAGLALALKGMMPNVHGLDFADCRSLATPTLGEQLTQQYHQQLRMLCFMVSTDELDNADAAPAAQDGHSLKLDFPLLHRARICCVSGPCPVLVSAVFPRSMGFLCIEVTAPVWQSISHMELPVAQQLKLDITSQADDDIRLPLSFNQLLTNSNQCGKVMLCANYHEPAACLPSVAFTGLTGLLVEVHISADMVLDIIGKLPRLVTLVVIYSTSEPIQADITIPGPGQCHPVKLLSTKLQTLSYGQQDIREQLHANIELYQYFLLKLPSLRRFGTGGERARMLVPFVEAYQEWYPHLAAVDFSRIDYQRI